MKTHYIDERRFVASFDVDPQKCFTPLCPDELPVEEGHHIVDELNAQAEHACLRLLSKEAHSPHAYWMANEEKPMLTPIVAPNMDCHWPQHAVPGSLGFELLDGLPKIQDYDYVVWKGMELDLHPYGSCYHDMQETLSTGVIEFLKANQIKTVVVGGLATDVCVRATVLQLLQAKFSVVLNLGAARGLSEEGTLQTVDELTNKGVLVIASAAQLKNRFAKVSSGLT